MSAIAATLPALLLRLALVAGLLAPATAGAASLSPAPGPRPGPDVLYAPPAAAPQLTNGGVWRAPPILVSGATAYRQGEFLYQDWLYDDRGAGDAFVYPSDPRYAGNSADLVEVRLRPLAGDLAIRLSYNSMVDPSVQAATIALGGSAAPLPVPHGANAAEPGRLFVTVHGTTADAVDALTGAVVAPALPVGIDTTLRQVEVRVPYALFDPRGQRAVRIAAAAGLWDPTANAYVPQNGSSLINVAFRGGEPASPWRTTLQSEALRTGNLTPFFALVDFTKLAAGVTDDSAVPTSGFMDRIMASANEDREGRGDAISRKPGCTAPCALQYSGRLQPYEVYVPAGPPPRGGWGLTLDLHGCGQTYNIGYDTVRQRQLGDRAPGSIVLTPEARGDCYWYFDQAGADVFEAWADVARTYPLDPGLTAITGISMGGYGAYKLAASYPDLFARAGVIAPCPGAGVDYAKLRQVVPGGRSRLIAPLLPSLAWVPVMSWQTTGDRACRYRDQQALVTRLVALGYRYASLTFSRIDHRRLAAIVLGAADPLAAFLGAARIFRDPPHVAFVFSPAMHDPAHGLGADHAYWVSGIVPERPTATGRIDVTSYGLGVRAPGTPAATKTTGVLRGLPYVLQSHLGGQLVGDPAQPRLRISAHGVKALTIDALRARTGCAPQITLVTPRPLTVRLAGCRKTLQLR